MSNARNSRTTHPRKSTRKERAARRFSVHAIREKLENDYRVRKMTEAEALGVDYEAAPRFTTTVLGKKVPHV